MNDTSVIYLSIILDLYKIWEKKRLKKNPIFYDINKLKIIIYISMVSIPLSDIVPTLKFLNYFDQKEISFQDL